MEDRMKLFLTNIGQDGVNWIHLAQDRSRWRAPVDTIMNLGVRKIWCDSLTAASPQKRTLSMELMSWLTESKLNTLHKINACRPEAAFTYDVWFVWKSQNHGISRVSLLFVLVRLCTKPFRKPLYCYRWSDHFPQYSDGCSSNGNPRGSFCHSCGFLVFTWVCRNSWIKPHIC